MLVVFFCDNNLNIFWLLNGIFLILILIFKFFLICVKIWWIIDKFFKFRKFIFNNLICLVLVIVYCVNNFVFFFVKGVYLYNGWLLIIIFVVCVDVCFGKFFNFL